MNHRQTVLRSIGAMLLVFAASSGGCCVVYIVNGMGFGWVALTFVATLIFVFLAVFLWLGT